MFVYISGTGRMAEAIAAACRGSRTKYLDSKNPWDKPEKGSVVIHVGSKERFAETLRFCESNRLPLVHAATGQNDLIPKSPKCAIIVAPNCAVAIVRLIEKVLPEMKLLGQYGMRVQLDESHQASKLDAPSGTALAMAEKLEIPPESIRADRFGVSARAKHTLVFTASDIEIGLYTKTKGVRPYAVGALAIARLIVEQPLRKNGIYPVREILQL